MEAEFIGELQRELLELSSIEERSSGIAQDVVHLISFNLSHLEAELESEDEDGVDAGAEEGTALPQLAAAIESGIQRIESELELLREIPQKLTRHFDERLETVVRHTEAAAITGNRSELRHYLAGDESPVRRFSILGGVRHSARALIYPLAVKALYRRSASQRLSRRFKREEPHPTDTVSRIIGLNQSHSPRPEVLRSLPFYYQQPFLGQSRIGGEFWVDREEESQQIASAIRNHREGNRGCLLIIGERHSGKTALCRHLARRHFDKRNTYHLFPPAGGSIDTKVFKSRLEKELKLSGEYDELFSTLPEGSVLVLHDLELWWERHEEGSAVIQTVVSLIEAHSDRCFFVLELNPYAFQFLDRICGLSDRALARIECGSMDAETLKEAILRRHRSTGLRFAWGERQEADLSSWRSARLFTRYFDYTEGRIGTALQSWIANIDRFEDETLRIHAPQLRFGEELHELRSEWLALLLQFVLHKQLTFARIERVVSLPPEQLTHQLSTLCRMKLVTRTRGGVFEINRYLHHLLLRFLRERGLL